MSRSVDHRFAPAASWTAICRPDDPQKTLVTDTGSLLYGYRPLVHRTMRFTRTIEFRLATSHQPVRTTQQTESADVPIVVTTVEYPHATLTLRSVGHRADDGDRYDLVRWEIRVSEGVDELLTGLHVDVYEDSVLHAGPSWQPARTIYALPHDYHRETRMWRDDQALESPTVEAPGVPVLVSVPHRLRFGTATGYRPASGLETVPEIVPGGGVLEGAMIVPLDGAATDHVDLAWVDDALDRERAFWGGLMRELVPLRVPDADIQAMLQASARNILQAREEKDGRLLFQVGAALYRGLWMVDGHFLLEAAQYLHLAADARRGLDAVVGYARPSGEIVIMDADPHFKETGIAIATIVRQCELSGDFSLLATLWPTVRAAVDFIESLRSDMLAFPPDHPAYGLIRPAFPDGGASGERAEYTTALWCLAGLRMALTAAERVAPDDVAHVRERFVSLRDDLVAHAARYGRTLPDGTPYLPMILPGSGDHNLVVDPAVPVSRTSAIQPGTATWALAQALWPGEVLPPDHELVRNFLAFLDSVDDEEGIPAETGWLTYRSLWTYYASFAAHVWLYAGRPDKAVDYLYAFANHAAPTRVWREEQPLRATGQEEVCGDMPHNWASAEFVRLVRHLLVFEAGDGLSLLAGVPAEWLAPGAVIEVDRTPTLFGAVSLRVDVDATRISVRLHDPDRVSGHVVVHVPAGEWALDNDGRTSTVRGPSQTALGKEGITVATAVE